MTTVAMAPYTEAELKDEVARLQQAVAEANSRTLEARRRFKSAESALREAMAEEINLMNELIEAMEEETRAMKGRMNTAQPQPTGHCLEACDAPSLAMEVATDDDPSTTEDNKDAPEGQIYPRRIVPWDDFPARQEELQNHLSKSAFASQWDSRPNESWSFYDS